MPFHTSEFIFIFLPATVVLHLILARFNANAAIIATTINARDYDPAELARVAERIARAVPLWDFGAPDWLSDRGDLWTDPFHSSPRSAS